MRNKKYAIFCGLIVVAFLIAFDFWSENVSDKNAFRDYGSRTVQLSGKTIKVMVADTPELLAKGLGGRTGLAPNEGMLFVFDTEAKHRFWMKDMLFPIDILWLSHTGEVIDIRKSVSPDTYPTVFEPQAPARYVLELPSGFSESNKIKIGDTTAL